MCYYEDPILIGDELYKHKFQLILSIVLQPDQLAQLNQFDHLGIMPNTLLKVLEQLSFSQFQVRLSKSCKKTLKNNLGLLSAWQHNIYLESFHNLSTIVLLLFHQKVHRIYLSVFLNIQLYFFQPHPFQNNNTYHHVE